MLDGALGKGKRKFSRALSRQLKPMPGTDRLPRFRVHRDPENLDLLVGMRLADQYFVLSKLGTGGMSVVYKAKNVRKHRGKIVAVKTLRMQGLNDEMVVKRFQREAELLSRLNHPRIVQVHEYGYTKRGQPYFVMDYLIGRNLADVLKKERQIKPERARYIFNQVCGAVDHAHRCGVIHRDLKPGNIMLLDYAGEVDFVKVVDFGIARFQTDTHRLTKLGEVWGSPIYMSPEQCMGKPLDVRSDVYSVGIAMYESLTGEVPFLGVSYVDTMSKQINEIAQPFSKIRPDLKISDKLERVVFKALDKDPENRHQSMSELREDIEEAFKVSLPASLRTTTSKPAISAPNPRISMQTPALRTTQQRVAATRASSTRTPALEASINQKQTQGFGALSGWQKLLALLLLICVLAAVGYSFFSWMSTVSTSSSLQKGTQSRGELPNTTGLPVPEDQPEFSSETKPETKPESKKVHSQQR